MPLSDMYRTMLEATNPATWETNRQKQLMGEYELESKRRSMDAEQKLRELYSSGKNVSPQDVMSISPDLGIKLQQAGNQAYLQQLQAEDLMRKQQEYQAKTYAQYLGPLADTYFDDMRSGMKPEMALQKFRSAVGSSQKELEEKHGIRPQADFTQFSPEQILDRTTGLGVPSRHYKSLEEEQKSTLQMRERMAPSYGDIKPVWDSTRGQWVSTPQTQMPDFSGASATELNMLEKSLKGMPEGPEKEGLKNFLAQKRGQPIAQTPAGLTPLSEVKAEEAGAEEKARLKAQKEATVQQREDILSSIPNRDQIESLIDKSISSGVEQQVKGKLAPIVGASSEALEATKQLDVIAPQLKSITKSLAGAGAISDFEQKMMADAAGAIADPNVPAAARKAAFRTFMDIMEKADKSKTKGAGKLQIGHEESGYRFKGGNPADKSSWEKM